MNYVITGENYTSSLLHGLEGHFGIRLLSERELRESDLFFDKDDKLYVPSQSSLELVMERMARWPERLRVIEQLMDKYQCRMMMRTLFPDFEFSASKLSILQEEMFSPGRKYVIKPTKGFLAIGVRALEEPGTIYRTRDEIDWELTYNRQFFSERTLSGENMIIEQFIEGDEYAVDMFYSETGKPIITAIAYHPLPENSEYHHVLYYVNHKIFQKVCRQMESFFVRLNAISNLRSLPIHAEFKLTEGGDLIPVELNPLRYGGFGFADLSYYAHGQCPYLSFFLDKPYDWDGIWESEQHKNKHYAWVLAYKGAGIDTDHVRIKDVHARLRRFIGEKSLLSYQGLDYRNNPVFAIAYLAEDREERLTRWLDVEFRDFFRD